jgi:hypothetical protein
MNRFLEDKFEKIFDANNSKSSLRRASKEDPQLLFEGRNDCKIVGENDQFIFVLPLSYEACIWINSFNCGGGGATWAIGNRKEDGYYQHYTSNGYSFILAFNKHPTDLNNDLKYMIILNPFKFGNGYYEGKCWTQKDNVSYSLDPADDQNVEDLTGITEDQIIEYGKEFQDLV